MVYDELEQMQRSFDALQYCMYHAGIVELMCRRIKDDRVKGRLNLDKTMFWQSEPRRQPPQI